MNIEPNQRPRYSRILLALLLLALLLLASSTAFAMGGRMYSSPEYGDSAVYYDIAADGRILKIDYLERKGVVVAKLDLSAPDRVPFRVGWYVEEKSKVDFVLIDCLRRWYTCSTTAPRLRKASIPWTRDSDFAVLPLRADTVFLSDRATEPKLLVFDLTRHAIRTTVTGDIGYVNVSPDLVYLCPDSKRMKLAMGTSLWCIDVGLVKVIERTNLGKLIANQESSSFVGLVAMHKESGVILALSKERERMQLYWVDLARMKLIGQSEPMPPHLGTKFELAPEQNGELIFSCFETANTPDSSKPTGVVSRFVREKDRVISIEPTRFDPKEQIPLRDATGVFKVVSVTHFDYLSTFDLGLKVNVSLPGCVLYDKECTQAEAACQTKEFEESEPKRKADKHYQKLEIQK